MASTGPEAPDGQPTLQEYLKSKNEEAKGVLDRMGAGSGSGPIRASKLPQQRLKPELYPAPRA